MAKSLSRRVSAQETTIQPEEPNQSQYECPICIYWLNEPVLTSCGHRFCKKCITSWLKKQNPCCPIDNRPLSENDLFPDNYTRREIQQIRKACPNSERGCTVAISPLELDAHIPQCSFRVRDTINGMATAATTPTSSTLSSSCLFKSCGCSFQSAEPVEVDQHLRNEMATHLNLLMTAFNQNNLKTVDHLNDAATWDAPQKNGGDDGGTDDGSLLKALYERIVVLEQQSREKELKLEKLTHQMAKAQLHQSSVSVNPRYSGGVLVWPITQFEEKVAAMSADPNAMFYSSEAYTSPYGYRYCVRINISPKFRDYIGLHLHLMRSDNDFHLEWPFRGRIKISMIHRNLNETKHDIIMSKPEILAFHRPAQEVSPRGYGFLDYASIADVLKKGYVIRDTLTVKVQLSIV